MTAGEIISARGVQGLGGELPGHAHYGIQGPPGPQGIPGADGGYYIPEATQPDEATLQLSFSPSKAGMPGVEPVKISLPVGSSGGGSVEFDETTGELTISGSGVEFDETTGELRI